MTLNIPANAWAAFQWVTLASSSSDRTAPILAHAKLDYKPAEGEAPATLALIATDRYRVHRVVVDLPHSSDTDAEVEPWSRVTPARIFAEAAKHPTVGKFTVGKFNTLSLMPLTVTDSRIEAGFDGWGANFPPGPGNFPPVERLIEEPTDHEQGPIVLQAKFLADLAKWNLGGRRGKSDTVWTFTWSEVKGKPGPLTARRSDDGISAVALIQPNFLPNAGGTR